MKPVVLDGSVRVAFVIMYLTYAAWGLAVFVVGLQTINLLLGSGVEDVWALVVCVSSLLAAYAVGHGKDRLTAIFTANWVGWVSLYFFSLLFRMIFMHDWEVFPQVFLALGYLILPAWHYRFVIKRDRALNG